MKRVRAGIGGVVAVFAICGSVAAQSVNPRGLYFHTFTGAATGSEWATWGQTLTPGRYEFSDLRNGGTYRGTFAPSNSFVFDGGVGAGSFSSANDATIHFNFGGGVVFDSVLKRAPYTDDRFPVFYSTPVTGDTGLTGAWFAEIRNVNPRTGATESVIGSAVEVLVSGNTIRLTREGGTFYQGVWFSGEQAGFRVIDRFTPAAAYRTFPGSATSVPLNTVGDLRVTGANSMTFAVFHETLGALGSQVQTMQYMELTRVPAPWSVVAPLVWTAAHMARRRR